MRLTKLGHACLHLRDGDASVLIDPGLWSSGFENLRGLPAILITHQHADHVDMD
nr:MBL fold metallo-hydrolase [Geodermatophilaceae bacterium]